MNGACIGIYGVSLLTAVSGRGECVAESSQADSLREEMRGTLEELGDNFWTRVEQSGRYQQALLQ